MERIDMDEALKKKLIAAVIAMLGAFAFGESQLLDIEGRLSALEDIHPELAEDVEEEAEEIEEAPVEEALSDEDQIEADEAEAEAQPLIEADE
tara:strand:+ start:79 stop:357 length:279 start_codon:yes stop_codon:yes gene_type:complete